MYFRVLAVALVAVFSSHGQALSWGWQGHEVVGSIADQLLLGTNAKKKVKQYLGFSLQVAAPWADCVRSVNHAKNGPYKYSHDKKYGAPCPPFESAAEKKRMENYVARNWEKCTYKDGTAGCEDTYHFADVSIEHENYDRAYKGTSNQDIVSAINAAIGVLKGKKSPDAISIRDEKEALLLLAHFVGDLHQPLHVGSVYLDRKGNRINPDKGKYDKATETRGGNSILKDIDKKCKGSNLHSEWDGILKSLGPPATNSLVGQARAIKDTKGKVETFAETWASESVKKARSAFKGLTFSGAKKCDGHWLVAFDNRKKYLAARNKMQREQLAIAGARLAQLLKTIWP